MNNEWEYKKPAPKGTVVEIEIPFDSRIVDKIQIPLGHMGYRTRAVRIRVGTYKTQKISRGNGVFEEIEIPAEKVLRWRALRV